MRNIWKTSGRARQQVFVHSATDEHSFQSGGEVNKATALDHAAGSLQVHDPLRFVTTSLENHTLQSAPMKVNILVFCPLTVSLSVVR